MSVKNIKPLGFTWETNDPFLFCVHHQDRYPKGNDKLGPDDSLEGRNIGQDFTVKDGWRMYHGTEVPGFPAHPHRGFETITIVLNGLIDHFDSYGGAGRYGNGDVQWMTAGRGLLHAEMFPLTDADNENPLELFQIWLNLPRAKKFAPPHYVMLWKEEIPKITSGDERGRQSEMTLIAGTFNDISAPAPSPDSWAADPDNNLVIMLIKMDSYAQWQIPAAEKGINRSLYFYRGKEIKVAGKLIDIYHSIELSAEETIVVENSDKPAYLLMLQSKPINEPVVQHGPFVMNTPEEINQAFAEYRATRFGGWPWDRDDYVNDRNQPRYAKYTDGSEIYPDEMFSKNKS